MQTPGAWFSAPPKKKDQRKLNRGESLRCVEDGTNENPPLGYLGRPCRSKNRLVNTQFVLMHRNTEREGSELQTELQP